MAFTNYLIIWLAVLCAGMVVPLQLSQGDFLKKRIAYAIVRVAVIPFLLLFYYTIIMIASDSVNDSWTWEGIMATLALCGFFTPILFISYKDVAKSIRNIIAMFLGICTAATLIIVIALKIGALCF